MFFLIYIPVPPNEAPLTEQEAHALAQQIVDEGQIAELLLTLQNKHAQLQAHIGGEESEHADGDGAAEDAAEFVSPIHLAPAVDFLERCFKQSA